MDNNEIENRTLIHRVVESFIAEAYPSELPFLPIMWHHFRNVRVSSGENWEIDRGRVLKSCFQGLGFAQKLKTKPVAPYVMAVVEGTLVGLGKTVQPPSPEEIRKAVKGCARIFGASEELCDEMAALLPPIIIARSKEMHEEQESTLRPESTDSTLSTPIASSTFIDVEATISQLMGKQSPVFFRELIRRGSMHWSEAFVVYEPWSRGGPTDPCKGLMSRISDINISLRKNNVPMQFEPEKDDRRENTGRWELVLEENAELTGKIVEAQCLLESAFNAEQSGETDSSMKYLVQAHRLDPESGIIIVRMAAIIGEAGTVNWEGLDSETYIGITRYATRLRNAQTALRRFLDTISTQDDVYETFMRIQREWPPVFKASAILEAMVKEERLLSEEETHFLLLHQQVLQLREMESTSVSPELATQLFLNKIIQEVIKRSVAFSISLLKTHKGNDLFDRIQAFVRHAIFTECIHGKAILEYSDLEELKNKWVKRIGREAVAEFIQEECGVSPADQKRVYALERQIEQMKKVGVAHDDESLAKRMRKQLKEIKRVQELREDMRGKKA